MTARLSGVLMTWHASERGGFGFVDVGAQRYFLHRSHIRSGKPVPGATVNFTPRPAAAGAKYPRATEAVINDTTAGARTTTISAARAAIIREHLGGKGGAR